MHFIERLIQSIKDKKSVVCMGLDPRLDKQGEIPKYLIDELKDPSKIILEFNKNLIDHASDLIPVVKPQIAFYEKYEALAALKETIKYAHKKDLLVILDSKRNDIGSTSEAYAYSTFKVYNADACTINAYLGFDGIKPYLSYKEKGLFILVKTSNPSSKDFQDIFSARILNVPASDVEVTVDHITLERNYIHMAKLVSNELGVLIVLIIGPIEAENGKVSIKNMATEEQKIIDIGDLIDEIYTIIDEYGSLKKKGVLNIFIKYI